MVTANNYPPIPGNWGTRAQDALDALSEMTTPDEVTATFSTARTLAEAILGTPASGGTATRRAIRATGLLVTHRLGPALAAEALSWAASASTMLSSSGIEAFLEAAASAHLTIRPLRLENREVLMVHLTGYPTDGARTAHLIELWNGRRRWASWSDQVPCDICNDFVSHTSPFMFGHEEDLPPLFDPAGWLQDYAKSIANAAGKTTCPPTHADLFDAQTEEEQIALFEQLGRAERTHTMEDPRLFDLPDAILGRCLIEDAAAVLSNTSCPAPLRDRIRYPYDGATLEVAVRAGSRHFEKARVRRLLDDLNDEEHEHYMKELQREYLNARRVCGLNTLEALTTGRLAGLDLSVDDTAEVTLGRSWTWTFCNLSNTVADVLIHHPQAEKLSWLLLASLSVSPDTARRLAREAPPKIARIALQTNVPTWDLATVDAPLALECGPSLIAHCPGISAFDRPEVRIPTVHEVGGRRGRIELFDFARRSGSRYSDRPFAYPESIDCLQGPYREAPGWTVTLPESPAALIENSVTMRNCTRNYTSSVRAGAVFIVIVEDPTGRRFNASVVQKSGSNGRRYVVDQINSWANSGERPSWIAPALNRRLQQSALPLQLQRLHLQELFEPITTQLSADT